MPVVDADETARVYLPWAVAATFLPDCAAPEQAHLLVTTSAGVAAVNQLVGSARSGLAVTATDVARYDSVGHVQDQLASLRLIFALCAVVALTITALGILNLGLATVTHRARELSVRRAVGARRSNLFTLVLGASVLSGLLAAGLAVLAVSLGIQLVVPRLTPPTVRSRHRPCPGPPCCSGAWPRR